jgi:IS30 family transposase
VATQAENVRDCREKGRAVYLRGVEHHRACAKLTPEQIIEARTAYFVAGETQTAIAARLGVHSSTISRAVRGERWAEADQLAAGTCHEPA